ncbi:MULTISPECIES: hypothetical protein [Clostridium]|uniref:XRE family transcriptional regulator n=1 Tax=Clostridium cibarium TaxID=2762247 RepID=A0ABR8PQL9_9CLOT|nr:MULTISPECIES: hypothetical protein [Clostridium]MBD7910473.1 hypothetical protein [Clostridium cibarium]
MDNNNCIPSLDNYVAKFMDETGCTFEEACDELGIKEDDFINKRTIKG